MRASFKGSATVARCGQRAFVAIILLLGGCEGSGGDWQQLFSWMKDDEPSLATAPAVPASPVAAAPSTPTAMPYRICRECPVQGNRVVPLSDRIVGFVERIDRSPEAIAFVGWAMDQDNPNASLRLIFFAGGAPVAEGSTDLLRLDVISRYRLSGEGRHGFRISVPAEHFRAENTQVNLYALDYQGAMGLVRFSVAN